MDQVHRERIKAVRRRLEAERADGLLVTHRPNVLYLCGFTGDSGALLVEPYRTTLFTDGRFTVQAAQEARSISHIEMCPGPLPLGIGAWLKKTNTKCVGFDPNRLTVAQVKALRTAAGHGIRWAGVSAVVEGLRAVKSPQEIDRMRQASILGSEALQEVFALLKPGIREFEVGAEIDYKMRRKGAQGPSFETIVAFGGHAALPHARPTARRLRKNELVVLDAGAILADYCCDLTRTVFVGRASRRVRSWYQAVLDAQSTAREALKIGVEAGTVDAAARKVLTAAGLEPYFVHSTGHGLGLEVHEEPRLARGQKQKIQAGMVVTVEPGVYVHGVGGIRIEDDVVIHARGVEVLTNTPREFMEL